MLIRPDTYVGSCDPEQKEMWVFNEKKEKLLFKEITYVPGLYKIFGKYPEI